MRKPVTQPASHLRIMTYVATKYLTTSTPQCAVLVLVKNPHPLCIPGAMQHTAVSCAQGTGFRWFIGKVFFWLPIAVPLSGAIITGALAGSIAQGSTERFMNSGQVWTLGCTLVCAISKPLGDFCVKWVDSYGVTSANDQLLEVLVQAEQIAATAAQQQALHAPLVRAQAHGQEAFQEQAIEEQAEEEALEQEQPVDGQVWYMGVLVAV